VGCEFVGTVVVTAVVLDARELQIVSMSALMSNLGGGADDIIAVCMGGL